MTKRSTPGSPYSPPWKKLRGESSARDSSVEPIPAPWVRDPQFYYEDGSIILGIEGVLFKVQASLLKAHSEVFKDMFSMPLGDQAQAEGHTDERPIMIPGIKAVEFRSLLKMFYLPPSDNFFISLNSIRQSDTKAWREFVFYSDVARLSHRFSMPGFEKWAAGKLASLIATSINSALAAIRKHTEGEASFGILLDTLAHARLISDVSMEHNLRNAILNYSVFPDPLPTSSLLGLMHRPGQRQEEPAMFGFWFLALLKLGHQSWQQDAFTKQDRIALFSAQTHLTPLPKSLGQELMLPILTRPKTTKEGHLRVFTILTIADKCLRRLSRTWRAVFDSDYYEDILSNEMSKPISRLCELPGLRARFASAVRALPPCSCSAEALEWLDNDIKLVFAKLAGYYQDIN